MPELTLEPIQTLEGPINANATIVGINQRTITIDGDEAHYLDFKIHVDHDELQKIVNGPMTVGYPANLSPDTLLGKLVKRLGGDPTKTVDFNDFIGVVVAVTCDKEPGRDGKTYWRIDRDLVRAV